MVKDKLQKLIQWPTDQNLDREILTLCHFLLYILIYYAFGSVTALSSGLPFNLIITQQLPKNHCQDQIY
jgi:hypothetical protein